MSAPGSESESESPSEDSYGPVKNLSDLKDPLIRQIRVGARARLPHA